MGWGGSWRRAADDYEFTRNNCRGAEQHDRALILRSFVQAWLEIKEQNVFEPYFSIRK